MGTDGRWNGANSPIDSGQHEHEDGAERGDRRVFIAGLTPGSAHCTGKPRGSGWGTQGGLNCLTHALPRCLPTPTEEADGGGGTVDRAE